MNAEVKEMPDFHVAYVRKMGPYGKEICEAAFGELMQWAGPKGLLEASQMLGVYWDNPEVTPPEKCRVDACVVVPEGTETDGAVALQTICAGRYGSDRAARAIGANSKVVQRPVCESFEGDRVYEPHVDR